MRKNEFRPPDKPAEFLFSLLLFCLRLLLFLSLLSFSRSWYDSHLTASWPGSNPQYNANIVATLLDGRRQNQFSCPRELRRPRTDAASPLFEHTAPLFRIVAQGGSVSKPRKSSRRSLENIDSAGGRSKTRLPTWPATVEFHLYHGRKYLVD